MMHSSDANQIYSCTGTANAVGDYCHPNLRSSFNYSPASQNTENCLQECLPCNTCCLPDGIYPHGREYPSSSLNHDRPSSLNQYLEDKNNQFQCISQNCPPGANINFSGCNQNDFRDKKEFVKAQGDCCKSREYNVCFHPDTITEGAPKPLERACCPKKTSWTEPRICRCDPSDPLTSSKPCECECGATFTKEVKPETRKGVRFADEVSYIDCDKAFQNLEVEDVKELCSCCKECIQKGKDPCIGNPVIVYELPEPKVENTSVTHDDFCWQKTPEKEIPPWHPNIKDRWYHMDIPSLAETTYQCDFKPPPVVKAGRKPVYLAPQRETSDPCQKLAEEFSTWKKTSTDPGHVYHSSCNKCDKDLHRVHLHECDVAHLPPPYQCHGDGHICRDTNSASDPKFTLCEFQDSGRSRYWWRRTCCDAGKMDLNMSQNDLPPDIMKPAPWSFYKTSYMNDYQRPDVSARERILPENCSACEYCSKTPIVDQPITLCTKDPTQPFITQRGGIIGS